MIEIKNLSKIYQTGKNKVHALNSVSFTLPDKGLVFIVGKSGSGKSTLLNMLGTLDDITTGEIYVDGIGLSTLSEHQTNAYRSSYIGIIYQNYNLFENESVEENIKEGSDPLGVHYSENDIKNALNLVDLDGLERKKIKNLSGGQKQRVAIARALIKNPYVILGDEPTGNLDSKTARHLFELLKKISNDKLVIIITHDNESAYKYGDRIIRLSDGCVVEDLVRNEKGSNTDLDDFIYIDADSEIEQSEIDEINKNMGDLPRKIHKTQRKFIPHIDEKSSANPAPNFHESKTNCRKIISSSLRILFNNKVSLIVTSIVSVILIALLTISTTFMDFKGKDAIQDAVNEYGVNSMVLRKGFEGTRSEDANINEEYLIETDDLDLKPLESIKYTGKCYPIYNEPMIANFNGPWPDRNMQTRSPYTTFYANHSLGTIVCDEAFLRHQFGENYEIVAGSLYGIEETTKIIVPDFFADAVMEYNKDFRSNNANDPYENLVNESVKGRYTIGAIIKTDYKEKYSSFLNAYEKLKSKAIVKDDFEIAFRSSELYQKFSDDLDGRLNFTYTLNQNFDEDYQKEIHFANFAYTFASLNKEYNTSELFSLYSLYTYRTRDLEGDECKVSTELYNAMFGTSITSSGSPEFEVKTIYLNNFGLDQEITSTPKHQEKLIITDVFTDSTGSTSMYVSFEKFYKIHQFTRFKYAYMIDDTSASYEVIEAMKPYYFYCSQYAFHTVFRTINIVTIFENLFALIFWTLVGIEFLLIILHAFKTVKKEKYRFGVYKALGYSNTYLNLSTLIANAVMMVFIFAIAVITTFGLSLLTNYILQNSFYFYTGYRLYFSLTLLRFRFDHLCIYAGITFVILLLSTLIPLLKIRRIKPNNIIREAK